MAIIGCFIAYLCNHLHYEENTNMSQAMEATIGMKSSRQKGFKEDGVRLPQRTTTN